MEKQQAQLLSSENSEKDNAKLEFKQFKEAFESLRQVHKEVLKCVILNESLSLMRIKSSKEWESSKVIPNINECLKVISGLSMKGVKKLMLEVNYFDSSIEKTLREEFIENLENLKDLKILQVIEYQLKEVNADSFILFSSYQPNQVDQNFLYQNFTKGRNIEIETSLNKKNIVKQKISFNEAKAYEEDLLIVADTAQLNERIWKILHKENESNNSEVKESIKHHSQKKQKSLKIYYNFHNSTLKLLLECSKSLLFALNTDPLIKTLTFYFQESPNATYESYQRHSEEFDIADILSLEISSKLVINLVFSNTCNLNLIVSLMSRIKGIGLDKIYRNSFALPVKEIIELIEQKQASIADENIRNSLFVNLKTLKFHDRTLQLNECYQLFLKLKNLKKVRFLDTSYKNQILKEQNLEAVVDMLNRCDYLNIDKQLYLDKNYLTFSVNKMEFLDQTLEQVSQIFQKIRKIVHLQIDFYQFQSIQQKHINCLKFLSLLTFNPLFVSIKICTNVKLNEEFVNTVQKVKSFNLLLTAYYKLISPAMTYNPRHVILDLFDIDN